MTNQKKKIVPKIQTQHNYSSSVDYTLNLQDDE